MPHDEATVLDIVRAARLARAFVRGIDREAFFADLKTQSAVLHQLLIIGEAVRRLSAGFRNRQDAVPWRAIAGMRDKLIHAYDEVDLEEVWQTVQRDVPRLIEQLEPLVPGDEQ